MKKNNFNNIKLNELERGDYQTPDSFTKSVCKYIKLYRECNPSVVIEPTCGRGNFIRASIDVFDNIKTIYGIEVDESHYNEATDRFINEIETNVKLFNESIFSFNFDKITNSLDDNQDILVIGNPPWVTNSQLESINSTNIPQKDNFKKLSGLDAMTGKSNFDISEYIIFKLIEKLQGTNATIAMLCKNTVIKNIVKDMKNTNINISNIEMITFDAKDIFGVSCDASLLLLSISNTKDYICNVYNMEDKERKINRSFGWDINQDLFISDIDEYRQISRIDGHCGLEWRQGVKHDCSKIMQLKKHGDFFINGNKELAYIEESHIYPLLKSSDIKNIIINDSRFHVIITQKKVGENTSDIEHIAPKLWEYLRKNGNFLDRRKSSIYKNAPRFSIFGIGDYSFKPYKVCVSGFYKEPKFSLVFTETKKPMMIDDTCYFLGFEDYNQALITTVLLNSSTVTKFLKSIAFLDSKRPYTKEILMRIDLNKLYQLMDYESFCRLKRDLGIKDIISYAEYKEYELLFDDNLEVDECSLQSNRKV